MAPHIPARVEEAALNAASRVKASVAEVLLFQVSVYSPASVCGCNIVRCLFSDGFCDICVCYYYRVAVAVVLLLLFQVSVHSLIVSWYSMLPVRSISVSMCVCVCVFSSRRQWWW